LDVAVVVAVVVVVVVDTVIDISLTVRRVLSAREGANPSRSIVLPVSCPVLSWFAHSKIIAARQARQVQSFEDKKYRCACVCKRETAQ